MISELATDAVFNRWRNGPLAIYLLSCLAETSLLSLYLKLIRRELELAVVVQKLGFYNNLHLEGPLLVSRDAFVSRLDLMPELGSLKLKQFSRS